MDRRQALGLLASAMALPCAAQAGFIPEKLEALRSRLAHHPDIRSLLIERGGVTAFTHYRDDTKPGQLLGVASVTKSIVSTLTGIAIGKGLIDGVDEPLTALFEEARGYPELARVKLRHLLTLTTGFDRAGQARDDYGNFVRHFYSPGFLGKMLARRLVQEPGSRFYYSNIDSHLVGVAVARRAKMPLADFARDELFKPLGIESFDWARTVEGMSDGAAGLRLAASDMLRIGRMALQEGRWQDRQVVPARYMKEAISRQVATDIPARGPKELWGYGFLWWTASTAGDNLPAFAAAGYGGQFIHAVPALDLVAVAQTEQISRESAARTAALLRDFAVPAAAR